MGLFHLLRQMIRSHAMPCGGNVPRNAARFERIVSPYLVRTACGYPESFAFQARYWLSVPNEYVEVVCDWRELFVDASILVPQDGSIKIVHLTDLVDKRVGGDWLKRSLETGRRR